MTIVKKTIHVTAQRLPYDISVSIDTDSDIVVAVTASPLPSITVEPTQIPVVGSAILGPQGPPGAPGPPGPKGDSGAAGATFVYTQLAPAATWVVPHNMNKHPSVMVVDSGDTVIDPDIHYDSTVQLT